MAIAIILVIAIIVFLAKACLTVPQGYAYTLERLGAFNAP